MAPVHSLVLINLSWARLGWMVLCSCCKEQFLCVTSFLWTLTLDLIGLSVTAAADWSRLWPAGLHCWSLWCRWPPLGASGLCARWPWQRFRGNGSAAAAAGGGRQTCGRGWRSTGPRWGWVLRSGRRSGWVYRCWLAGSRWHSHISKKERWNGYSKFKDESWERHVRGFRQTLTDLDNQSKGDSQMAINKYSRF